MFNKDSDEVIAFLSAFDALVKHIGGDKHELISKYHVNQRTRKLADKLSDAVIPFVIAESAAKEKFIQPSNPAFIKKWRQYEREFQPLIGGIWLRSIMFESEIGQPLKTQQLQTETEKWDTADNLAKEEIVDLFSFVELAEKELETAPEYMGEDDLASAENGEMEWHGLVFSKHINIRQMKRRFRLLPTFLVPSHVAPAYKSSTLELTSYLSEALKSFIVGADYGSLMLLRSLVEITLRKHYLPITKLPEPNECVACGHSDKVDLEWMVKNCSHLPRNAPKAKLEWIRKLANDLIHEGSQRRTRKLLSNKKKFEVKMVSAFAAVRNLIENVPHR